MGERAAFRKAQEEAATAVAAFQRASEINEERRQIREQQQRERDQREYEAMVESERLEELKITKRRKERSRERERRKQDKNNISTNDHQSSNHNNKSRCRSSSSKKKQSIETRWQRFYDAAYEKEDSRFPSFRDMMEDSGLYFQSCLTIGTGCFGDENTLKHGISHHTECLPDFCATEEEIYAPTTTAPSSCSHHH